MRPRWTRLAILLLPLVFAEAARAQDGRDADELLDDGRRAFEREEFSRARADLWAYLDATASLTGPERLPQAEALWYIALMEPDAAVAAQHYQIIVDEFAASSYADQALFRLGQYDLVDDRPAEARSRFDRLRQNYPFSRAVPELPMWIGRSHLTERQHAAAIEAFLQGFTMVKSGDVPQELPAAQREALAAEYAWWLASAYREEGDERTAAQYYTLLTFDYPNSPQAAEARVALGGAPPAAEVAALPPVAEPPREEPVYEEPPPVEPLREEPVYEEPRGEVAVQPVRPAPEPGRELPAGAISGPGVYYLQVGAFTSATNAAELSKRLKGDGFASNVEVAVVDGRGYYRVRVGPFRVPGEADSLATNRDRLGDMGYPSEQVASGP